MSSGSNSEDISSIYRSRICSLDLNNDSNLSLSNDENIDTILYTDNTILNSVLNEVIASNNFTDNKDMTIDIQYLIAIKHNDIEYLLKLLKAFPNLMKSVDITAKNGLHIAVIENHYDLVELLLKFNFPINGYDDTGKTALHFCNDPLIMELLLRFNPSIDLQDSHGFTPLHIGIHLLSFLIRYTLSLIFIIT